MANLKELAFVKAQIYSDPSGRRLRFWGRSHRSRHNGAYAVYVFFDTDTDQCVELESASAKRLKRLKQAQPQYVMTSADI